MAHMRCKTSMYEEELKNNPELKESDVQALREWYAKQPHLPKISDLQLARFLHSNHFRVEPTKARIEAYYTTRTHLPEFFSNRDPVMSKGLRIAHKTLGCFILEKTTAEGGDIAYIKVLVSETTNCSYSDCVKHLEMVIDLLSHTKGLFAESMIIFNLQNVTLGHLRLVRLMEVKKHLFYVQEAAPIRLNGIHFMKASPIMDVLMRMLTPFMKKELARKIHIHSTLESLLKFVPLDALPNEDGGKAGNVADLVAESIKWLDDNRAWFQTDEATMRVNESLRPGKAKTSSDMFGVEGSFKRLDID